MSPSDKSLILATGNVHKYREIARVLSEYNIGIEMDDIKGDEIQSDSLEEIAAKSVESLEAGELRYIIVEDSGLFIDALRGFPGPYSSYVFDTLGTSGILKLLEGLDDRGAYFKSVIAFLGRSRRPLLFEGVTLGEISKRALGSEGFGFDPVFVPAEGDGRTFGQMSVDEKNSLSHRSRAVRRFAETFLSER